MSERDESNSPETATPGTGTPGTGSPRRRGFLKALGLAGGAAAATAATAMTANAAEAPSRADAVPSGLARKENAAERVAARYRETDHVKLFYLTNRY